MGDYVRKILPYDIPETDAIEGWLEEMAREGLVLHSKGYLFFCFQRKESRQRIYRMERASGAKLDRYAARRAQLLALGWTYVTSVGKHDIYQTEDMTQRELPEDANGSRAKPKGKHKDPFAWVAPVLLSLALLALIVYWGKSYFVSKDFLINMIEEFTWWDLLNYAFPILAVLILIPTTLGSSRRRQRRVREGRFPDRSAHSSERARSATIVRMVVMMLVVTAWVCPFQNLRQQEWLPLENYTQTLPLPRVEELDGIPATEGDFTRKTGPLAREVVFIFQEGSATAEKGVHSYRARFYDLRAEQLASRLLMELRHEDRMEAYESIPARAGVQVFYAMGEGYQKLLLQYNALIMDIYYGGEADLRDCLPIFEAYLGVGDEAQLPDPLGA